MHAILNIVEFFRRTSLKVKILMIPSSKVAFYETNKFQKLKKTLGSYEEHTVTHRKVHSRNKVLSIKWKYNNWAKKNNKNTRCSPASKTVTILDYSLLIILGSVFFFISLLLLLLFIYGMTLMITCPKWDFVQYVHDCLQTMFNQSAIIARKHVHTFATHIYLLSSYLKCSFLIRMHHQLL